MYLYSIFVLKKVLRKADKYINLVPFTVFSIHEEAFLNIA